MLRRITVAIIVLTIAILIQPCAPASPQQSIQHQCCAPSAVVSTPDCCNNAAPSPATAPGSSQQLQQSNLAFAHDAAILAQHLDEAKNLTARTATANLPAYPPATILRT